MAVRPTKEILFVINKVFLFLVEGPAVIAGFILFAGQMAGLHPAREVIESVYAYADMSFRDAPAGYVLRHTCADTQSADNVIRKPVPCTHYNIEKVSLEADIDHAMATLYSFWLFLIALTIIWTGLVGLGRFVIAGDKMLSEVPKHSK
jgi:hypothetical protein